MIISLNLHNFSSFFICLTVVDKNGKKYAVRYSETLISAKPCNCTENYHIIIARSEVDKHGRFASCMFNVHVFGKSSFSDLQIKNENKLWRLRLIIICLSIRKILSIINIIYGSVLEPFFLFFKMSNLHRYANLWWIENATIFCK
jgi:hypothetical protein